MPRHIADIQHLPPRFPLKRFVKRIHLAHTFWSQWPLIRRASSVYGPPDDSRTATDYMSQMSLCDESAMKR